MYFNMLVSSMIFVMLCACSSIPENQKFESNIERALGKENYSFIEHSEKVSVMQVTREGKDGYKVTSEEKLLTPEQVANLRTYLLSDSSYYFERRKKCLFVPEYAFKFQGKNRETVLLVSYACPQIKVLLNNHFVIIDNDPISPQMEAFTKNLF